MRKKIQLALLSFFMVAGIMNAADNNLRILHLGINNTLIRIDDVQNNCLLIPVQEDVEDAKFNVLLGGKMIQTFYVRLAMNRIDYYVPFDLTQFKGKCLQMSVVTNQGRNSIREVKADVCWRSLRLADEFDTSNREKYRPVFHHTPLYGWMNDPNGMFYKDGVWHLYYQHNPYGSLWQNMSWGHSTSTDLIHWEHKPLAVSPDGLGAIFSGSCAVEGKGTPEERVIAFYTSADVSQTQSFAVSHDDGLTFEPYACNPVITNESESRDPKIFFHEPTGKWVLILAHALEHEMLIYNSDDLKNWTLESSFGKGLGCQDGVWECPDLMEINVEGTDEKKWILICNINPGGPFGGSASQYFIGEFDGKTFKPDTEEDGSIPTKWLDFGKDNYATVSWSGAPDGRHTIIGWMSNWQYAAVVPTKQYRSANTLPRELGLFRAEDGRIYTSSKPSPELGALEGELHRNVKRAFIGKKRITASLPSSNSGACIISMNINAKKLLSKDNAVVNLTLSNKAGEKCELTYHPDSSSLSFDRTNSGETSFSMDFPSVTTCPTFESNGQINLKIFVDCSSIEVFCNDGKSVMTNIVFPSVPYNTLTITSEEGTTVIENLDIKTINI